MSDPRVEPKALISYSGNFPAKVQAAGRQLAIATQLKQELDRKWLVATLKRINKVDAQRLICELPLEGILLEQYLFAWNWNSLSRSQFLLWSSDLIKRFEGSWEWEGLSSNMALPWSLELIERLEGRWGWRGDGGARGLA